MKKSNNKYHSNNNSNNNSIYSLNYKFDSISPAGKTCGTALDLIKKYNDLAKEAHGNGNYVEAEVFRQYAEHYRKIVTEINERKTQRQAMFNNNSAGAETAPVAAPEAVAEVSVAPEQTVEEAKPAKTSVRRRQVTPIPETSVTETEETPAKREFKVIEISSADSKSELIAEAKPARAPRRKTLSVAVL